MNVRHFDAKRVGPQTLVLLAGKEQERRPPPRCRAAVNTGCIYCSGCPDPPFANAEASVPPEKSPPTKNGASLHWEVGFCGPASRNRTLMGRVPLSSRLGGRRTLLIYEVPVRTSPLRSGILRNKARCIGCGNCSAALSAKRIEALIIGRHLARKYQKQVRPRICPILLNFRSYREAAL